MNVFRKLMVFSIIIFMSSAVVSSTVSNFSYNQNKTIDNPDESLKSYLLNDSIYWFPTINFIKILPPFIYQRNYPSADVNEINNIIEDLRKYDEDPLPRGLTTDYDEARQLVHYFPIKIDESKDSIISISVNWHGRATDDLQVRMYCWFSFIDQFPDWFGHWENVISRKSNSSYIWINNTMTNEIPVTNGYIHICIVAIPDLGYKSTLFSDYIEVNVLSEDLANDV